VRAFNTLTRLRVDSQAAVASMSLPSGYTAIRDAPQVAGMMANFIGVLSDVREPFMSRGNDFVLDFTIQDDSGSSTLRCRLFRRLKASLPTSNSIGDIVLLRNVKIGFFNGSAETVIGGKMQVVMIFFPAKDIPAPEFATGYGTGGLSKLPCNGLINSHATTPAEVQAIIQLKARTRSTIPQVQQKAATRRVESTYKRKLALIKDLEPENFYDVEAEVVKWYSADPGTVDLYVTDYTSNKDLFYYEDPELPDDPDFPPLTKWQGPFGQITIAVRLYEPHASYAGDRVRDGDLVYLSDVHTKLSDANKLEGVLHQDPRFSDKVKIRKITRQDRIDKHLARKEAYYDQYAMTKAKKIRGERNAQLQEPRKNKRQKKLEQKRNLREQEQRQLEEKVEKQAITLAGINSNGRFISSDSDQVANTCTVRASHPDIRLSTIDEILHNPARMITRSNGQELELPFVNAKYRARLRIVDFSPKDLCNFSQSMTDPSWNVDFRDRRRDDRWQWGFVLLVEAADIFLGETPERFPLFLDNDSGEHLLKMDATE
jgi:protection-of-telomeres protein 1